jgi:hypothetical protein
MLLFLSQTNRTANLIWIASVLSFGLLECVVIYSLLMRPTSTHWLLHLIYLPVMLSLPISTGWPLYNELKKRSEIAVESELIARISYSLAVSTLVSYLTLLIVIGELL